MKIHSKDKKLMRFERRDPMVKYRVKITDIIEEAHGTKTYILEKPEDFTWVEGSHTHIGMVGYDEGEKPNKAWVRHMSIMTLPEENKIGFTTRILSPYSEFKEKLSKLHIGDEIILFKIGSRMNLRRENRPIVLISMGVGIATMRPLIHSYIKEQTGIPNIININVDSSNEFIYKAELDNLTNMHYQNYWLGSRKEFYETLDTVSEQSDAIYYIVGSDGFIKDVIKLLKNKMVSENSILIDKKEEILGNYFVN